MSFYGFLLSKERYFEYKMQLKQKSIMDEDENIRDILKEIRDLLAHNKKVLNVDDLVLYTGLSKSKIYKLTQLKLIPVGRNKHIRQKFFDKDTIDAWLLGNIDLSDEILEHKDTEQLFISKKTIS
jgi:predicted DNA-binding transcriptional regulator AlpA